MKRIQRTTALLLALLTLLAAFSVPAFAASTKVVTLQTGKWHKITKSDQNTLYELKLSADSIVTLNWKEKKEYCDVEFYDSAKANNSIFYASFDDASGTYIIAMSKGTYYIQMCELGDNPTAQIKITTQKAVNPSNYCRAKAIALKAGQTVKIAQTADYFYSRWYKITVPKKKTVTITTNEGRAENIILYDSKMRQVGCTSGSKKVITEDKIDKGTYYIRVLSPRYSDYISEYIGQYITVKWN